MDKQAVLEVLNSFKIIKVDEEDDEIRVWAETKESNLKALEDVGIKREDTLTYSHEKENIFCIATMAFDLTDANCWDGEKLVIQQDGVIEDEDEVVYYNDYPNEPIGGGNPYYRCCYCGISDPQINGMLSGHASYCEYRIKKEKEMDKRRSNK